MARHGRDEAIAMTGHILNVTHASLAVSQDFAERRDVNSESAFFDDGVGPNACDQIGLFDDLPGTLNEGKQNLACTAA
jgi:hypothetical protein